MISWSHIPEYLPLLMLGVVATIEVSVGAVLLSIPLGLLWALCRLSGKPIISTPVGWMINVIRGTPIIVFLFYIYFVIPDLGIELNSMQAAIFGLAFAYSTYLSEIFRADIEAVDSGQMEAARSIGMGKTLAMRRVVLPQALRIALPPFANMLVMMIKDSAIASTIAVTEITRQGQLLASATFDNTTIYTLVAVIYLAMTLPLMSFTKWLENRFGKNWRR